MGGSVCISKHGWCSCRFCVICVNFKCLSMSKSSEMAAEEDMSKEIERLQQELDQTSNEKNQAAQFGLVLLEEKESLQTRCEELEALYENTRHELQITQEGLSKFQNTDRVTAASGIETEESLLSESAARETSLNSQIIELELEAKQVKTELERVQSEKGRYANEFQEILKQKELSDH